MTFASTIEHSRKSVTRKAIGLRALFALARQRRQLARLDDAALKDMGITRADARREAQRAAWDVPSHWRG
ncbi:DUF1127 domain-containing protein [Shimia biformata]|uniref:DUF1127 domain-containing protein n=1 Tax=Shimia biformata TaxID=1294299 RepID=UPI00194E9436|nr:DUF1127 domain-containing protein [Shimia biformata]